MDLASHHGRRTIFRLAGAATALAIMSAACIDDEATTPAGLDLDAGGHDASLPDGSGDARATDAETVPDASPDDANAIDATADAAADAEADASSDATLDATADADIDASGDATADASSDATLDATADADIDASGDAALVDAGPPGTIATSNVAATQVDLVSPGDVGTTPDGTADGTFELTAAGPIDGLILVTTDAGGAPASGQQWDTLVGADAIPSGLGLSFSSGGQTWVLGVFEAGVLQNDANGRIALGAGTHALTVVASSSGYFVSGQHFRIYAHATGGAWSGGPVVTWP